MGFFNDLFHGNFKHIWSEAKKDTGEFIRGEKPLIEGGGVLGSIINSGVNTVAQPILKAVPDPIRQVVGNIVGGGGGVRTMKQAPITMSYAASVPAPMTAAKVTGTDGKQYQQKSDGSWSVVDENKNTLYLIIGIGLFLFLKKK